MKKIASIIFCIITLLCGMTACAADEDVIINVPKPIVNGNFVTYSVETNSDKNEILLLTVSFR